tara:strand:- start:907 stop:1110 length:204 start_codon:yes stop_codon:yes gene_type:complete
MSKPTDKSKEQVRSRRQRNLVAKDNRHKGGYHTSDKYDRRPRNDYGYLVSDWERMTDLEMEYGDELR